MFDLANIVRAHLFEKEKNPMNPTETAAILQLTESMEDYLEEIYDQINSRQVARVRDIAGALNVSMSSVTGALKKLAQKGLINYDKYQYITLTPEGLQLAAEIKGRHRILTRFLEEALGVPSERAEANACRMEHAMDKDVIDRFLAALEFIKTNPEMGPDWGQTFRRFYSDKQRSEPTEHAQDELDLADVRDGDSVVITRIENIQTGDNRIAQMGLLPGTAVFIQQNPGPGGSIKINANGAEILLSTEEGHGVHVRKIVPASGKVGLKKR